LTAAGEEILTRPNAVRGGCRIVVGTVYDPTDGTGEMPAAGLPPWPHGPALL
jgi:hypothetical protein